MGAALYGADGAGNADYAPPYPGSYQLGIRPGHLGGRTLSLSNGLFGTARCKGRLLVRRKRRAHEKGHPAAADGISEPDRPLFPRFWSWRYHQSREQVRALSRQSDIISMVLRMDNVELLDLAFGFVRGCYNQQIKKEQEAENNGEM